MSWPRPCPWKTRMRSRWSPDRLLGLILLACAIPVHAQVSIPDEFWLPSCARQIAVEYQVPLDLLQAIRIAEGGRVGQSVCRNKNGTCDNGPMQINDNWFNGKFDVNLTELGIDKAHAVKNECQNVLLGAWVLRSNFVALKDWREATAAYNAGIKNRAVAYPYADRVFRWKARLNARTVVSRSSNQSSKPQGQMVIRSSRATQVANVGAVSGNTPSN